MYMYNETAWLILNIQMISIFRCMQGEDAKLVYTKHEEMLALLNGCVFYFV